MKLSQKIHSIKEKELAMNLNIANYYSCLKFSFSCYARVDHDLNHHGIHCLPDSSPYYYYQHYYTYNSHP